MSDRTAPAWVAGRQPPVLAAAEAYGGPVRALDGGADAHGPPPHPWHISDLRDEDGGNTLLRVLGRDMAAAAESLRRRVFLESPAADVLADVFDRERVAAHGVKTALRDVRPALLRIAVVDRLSAREGGSDAPVLFLADTPWAPELEAAAEARGVRLHFVPVPSASSGPGLRDRLAALRRRLRGTGETPPPADVSPRVAVVWSGREFSTDAGRAGELAWLDDAGVAPEDVVALFTRTDVRLDRRMADAVTAAGARPLAAGPDCAADDGVPVWRETARTAAWERARAPLLERARRAAGDDPVARRATEIAGDFVRAWAWHRDLWEETGVRTVVNVMDFEEGRIAGDQALADLGGAGVSRQYSCMHHAPARSASVAHVFVGWSPMFAEVWERAGSRLSHFVSAGCPWDAAFPAAARRAESLRDDLRAAGADRILTWFDEGCTDARDRPVTPARFRAEHDALLRMVEEAPDLGLVLKPRRPAEHGDQLGPDLLARLRALEDQGRCRVLRAGALNPAVLPAEAGLAADLAAGPLLGGTAVVEAALSGARAVHVDDDDCLDHPLRQGPDAMGRSVLAGLDDLVRRFAAGDVDDLGLTDADLVPYDPWRDGRAQERFGTWVGALHRGACDGRPRTDVLAELTRIHRERWGADSVLPVPRSVPA